MFKLPFSFMGWVAKRLSPQKFSKLIKSSYSDSDLEILKNENIEKFLVEDIREAFKNGADGPSWDAVILFLDWGFNLQDINFKIHIFHGTEDKIVPMKFAEYKEKHLPNNSYTEYKGEGHLNLVTKFDEILLKVIK